MEKEIKLKNNGFVNLFGSMTFCMGKIYQSVIEKN